MENASASMAKRFQLLFVLPKSLYSIIATQLAVVFLLALAFEYCYGLTISSLFSIFGMLILQALVLQVTRIISSHLSPIATTRRLAASLTIVDAVWLFASSIILLVRGFNPAGASDAASFSFFIALAFGVLIFWPVFADNVFLALAISTLNVAPFIFLFALFAYYERLSVDILSLILGLGYLTAMLLTLGWINRSARKSIPIPSFRLLKAFLAAWVNLDGGPLESMLSGFRESGSVATYLVEFNSGASKKTGLVVPEVHPGPFAPVGAFDLPGKIYWHLKGRACDEILVLHGAVDHSMNLINSKDVERYLAQLTIPPTEGTFSSRISIPLSKQSGDTMVTGMRFGDSLCIFTSVPKGSEDYPSSFREAVRDYCAKIGYRRVIIVDAHNSIGETPSDTLQSQALQGIKEVASELFSAAQFEFSVGSASKQFTFSSISNADIGAGGLACLILEIGGVDYALVSVDSNNSLVGLREQIKTMLAARSIRLLEFCTSDSHFNAARIRNKRGYSILGEITPPTKIADAVTELAGRAREEVNKASVGIYEWVAQVNLPKADLLERMETTLTEALNSTKNGLAFILGLLLVELAFVLML